MKTKTWSILQLFAEGEGGAAPSGAENAVAGHTEGDKVAPEQKQKQRATQGQAAAATEEKTGRLTWEQIKQDPEYSAQLQNLVRSRLKNAKQAQEDLAVLSPVLEAVAKSCGTDPGDYPGLVRAVADRQTKVSETARQQEQAVQEHFYSLQQQADRLRRKYPGFDLQRELQNPAFARLTAPHVGVSLEDAYYTVHRNQIESAALRVAARRTADRISGAIRAGSLRPVENGTSGAAPSVTAFDYRNASPAQREALKARIRKAGARGEKIYPGEM